MVNQWVCMKNDPAIRAFTQNVGMIVGVVEAGVWVKVLWDNGTTHIEYLRALQVLS